MSLKEKSRRSFTSIGGKVLNGIQSRLPQALLRHSTVFNLLSSKVDEVRGQSVYCVGPRPSQMLLDYINHSPPDKASRNKTKTTLEEVTLYT